MLRRARQPIHLGDDERVVLTAYGVALRRGIDLFQSRLQALNGHWPSAARQQT
jgi:hypothetical protein